MNKHDSMINCICCKISQSFLLFLRNLVVNFILLIAPVPIIVGVSYGASSKQLEYIEEYTTWFAISTFFSGCLTLILVGLEIHAIFTFDLVTQPVYIDEIEQTDHSVKSPRLLIRLLILLTCTLSQVVGVIAAYILFDTFILNVFTYLGGLMFVFILSAIVVGLYLCLAKCTPKCKKIMSSNGCVCVCYSCIKCMDLLA